MRAAQFRDGAGLIALVDRSDDVRASLDAADFEPRVKLRTQPERVAPVATVEADERVDRERHVGHLYKGARRHAAIELESHVFGRSKDSAVGTVWDGPQQTGELE